uniref:Uncharacterized LOC103181216 n=1 Tax=Callorhinchus milii TaxID=7868 RepID=A0A4W3K096_CALMI
MSFISAWNQRKRFLHGLMLFLLLLKSISLLRINRLMAPCVSMLRMSYSSLMMPMLCGIIFIVAYSCLGNLLFLSESYSFSTFVRAFQTVLMYFMGLSEMRTLSTLYKLNQLCIAIYYGTFFVIMTILWAGLNFYLDEFEDLMDELLFRLNAMSNSLHHALPPKQPHYLEDGSPSALAPGLYSNQASENPILDKNPVHRKLHKLEAELFRNNQEAYELLKPGRECWSNSDITDIKTLRSKVELETLRQLQLCQENNLHGKSESPQSGRDSRHSPKKVKTDSSTVQKDRLVPNWKSLTVDSCDTLDLLETSCNAILELCSSHNNSQQSVDALSTEHYNLAKLGDTLPHVLCGIKCPEKQAAQSRMIESKVASQQRCSSASTSGKNRKQLKRSHTIFIQMLNDPSELSGGKVEIYEQLAVPNTLLDPLSHCLGNLTVQSSSSQPSSDKIPSEKMRENQVESEVKPVKRAAEPGESSALYSEGKTEQNENMNISDLPGSVKHC